MFGSRDDLAALFWLVFGLWILFTQFDANTFWTMGAQEVTAELYKQKEELIFFFTAVWQLYVYINSQVEEVEADRRAVKDTLNVSVNRLVNLGSNYALNFRTIREMPPSDLFLDKIHLKRIEELADETEVEQPFLQFNCQKPRDQEVNKIVANYLSSLCADGHLAKEMGLPVREDSFVFGLTNEKFGGPIAFKLRLMLVREDTLKLIYRNWVQREAAPPEFEALAHANRFKVLKKMSKMYFDRHDPDHAWIFHNKLVMAMRTEIADSSAIVAPALRKRSRSAGTDADPDRERTEGGQDTQDRASRRVRHQ